MDPKLLKAYRKIYNWAENAQRPGGEFDWFVVDRDDHVAGFATAGFGPVPDSVFSAGIEKYLLLIGVIEEALDHSSELHGGGFHPYSERGLFAYDFRSCNSGQYELAAKPESAITVFELMEKGVERDCFVEFCGKFAECNLIVPEAHWSCR